MPQPKVMTPEAGNGGRTVIAGAAGGWVSTLNERVAASLGTPNAFTWITAKV